MNDLERSDLEKSLRHQLRLAERDLDADNLAALRNSRERALRQARFRRWPRLLMPALGMAAASVVAGLMLLLPPESPDPVRQGDYLSADSAEFYQDLDFYHWLSQNDKTHRS